LGRYKTLVNLLRNKFNNCSNVILLHKKVTWPDFGRVYIPIYPPPSPRRYAPGLALSVLLMFLVITNPANIDINVSIFIIFERVQSTLRGKTFLLENMGVKK